MNRYLNMAAMFAMASTFNEEYGIEKHKPFKPDLNPIEPPRPKNHKRFIIDGVEIWALSEKRAIEKRKKYL